MQAKFICTACIRRISRRIASFLKWLGALVRPRTPSVLAVRLLHSFLGFVYSKAQEYPRAPPEGGGGGGGS
jgi:hypothetical protein